MWKKLRIILDDKIHEFSFGKTRFLIAFHLLNLWAFAVSFPNGGSSSGIYSAPLALFVGRIYEVKF